LQLPAPDAQLQFLLSCELYHEQHGLGPQGA